MSSTPPIRDHGSERSLIHHWAGIGLLCLLFTGLAHASELPTGYPQGFQRYGVIDRVDLAKRSVVIGDNYYRLSKPVTIHSPALRNVGIRSLRQRLKCGFSVSLVGNGAPFITELWILPRDYEMPRNMMVLPLKKID